jgi:hypothetical protein
LAIAVPLSVCAFTIERESHEGSTSRTQEARFSPLIASVVLGRDTAAIVLAGTRPACCRDGGRSGENRAQLAEVVRRMERRANGALLDLPCSERERNHAVVVHTVRCTAANAARVGDRELERFELVDALGPQLRARQHELALLEHQGKVVHEIGF